MTQQPTRGRPRAFDPDRALQTAMLTFWRGGYHGTSVEDLVAATGAPRASLYALFGDKQALLLRCLDTYGMVLANRVEGAMARDACGQSVVAALFAASADRMTSAEGPPGCLRCNMTLELAGTDRVLDDALHRSRRSAVAAFEKVVTRDVANGALDARRSVGLPVYLVAVLDGMVTAARGGALRGELQTIIQEMLRAWSRAARLP